MVGAKIEEKNFGRVLVKINAKIGKDTLFGRAWL